MEILSLDLIDLGNVQGTPATFADLNLKDLTDLDVIRKEAYSFYGTISGVRLCWELEEPQGPKGYP